MAQVSGQNSIDDFTSKRITIPKAIALRAVAAWRQVLTALPASLGSASLSEFLEKFARDPVFCRGDKASVHWLADGKEYEAFLRGFGGHGQCLGRMLKRRTCSHCASVSD